MHLENATFEAFDNEVNQRDEVRETKPLAPVNTEVGKGETE